MIRGLISGYWRPPNPVGNRPLPLYRPYNEQVSYRIPRACATTYNDALPETLHHPGLPSSNFGDIWTAQIGLRPRFMTQPQVSISGVAPNPFSIQKNSGG